MKKFKPNISKKDKKKNKIVITVFFIIIIIVIILLLLKKCSPESRIIEEVQPPEEETTLLRGHFKYLDKEYEQSMDRKVVLVVGTNDNDAEYLLLIVVNENNQTLLPIHISRSTKCTYTKLNELGKIEDTVNGRIEETYSNGSKDLVSLINTREAVSDLFCNIRIDYCVSMDLNSISDVVDIIGPTSFTMPGDYNSSNISLSQGELVTITTDNAKELLLGDEDKETVQSLEARQNKYVNSLFELGHASLALDKYYFTKTMPKLANYVIVNSNEVAYYANDVGSFPKLPLVCIDGRTEGPYFIADQNFIIDLCIENIYK